MLEDKLSQIKKSLEKIASYTQKMGGVSLDETHSQIDSDIIFQNLLSELNIPPLAQKEQISSLKAVDQFYQPIGGLLGYYRQALQLLLKEPPIGELKSFSRAPGFDIEKKEHQALMEGLQALPYLILMYPIGGLASRLDFKHPSGQTAPAALLPFMGRSLLEGLIRDVQALEMVYERFFSKKIVMPIAMMTSDENEQVILDLLEQMHYFGRSKDLFWLFKQPSVPVVDEQGSWVFASDLSLMMQPGGHGAIWQAAKQQGVLQNMHKLGKKYLLVRQINNPIAGMDHALLSLIGLGCRENKAFGFLSCERDHTAAEGALALIHDQQGYKISNLEYTQLVDLPNEGLSTLSANTNILFVDLEKIAPVFEKSPLNGFLLNMKQTLNPHENKKVGRLETMMQGVSDQLMAESIDQLPVFVAYQKRLKTIASTKKRFTGSLQETPEGAYYHYYLNHYEWCKSQHFQLPPLTSADDFIHEGPSFLFHYHPQLGPLFSLLACKLQKLKWGLKSELAIEPVDTFINTLDLQGSLLIEGKGKCVLKQVHVINKGVGTLSASCWRADYERREALAIILHEQAEFHAEGVVIKGNQVFEVPAAERWILTASGLVKKKIDRPTWSYRYKLGDEGRLVAVLGSCGGLATFDKVDRSDCQQ